MPNGTPETPPERYARIVAEEREYERRHPREPIPANGWEPWGSPVRERKGEGR